MIQYSMFLVLVWFILVPRFLFHLVTLFVRCGCLQPDTPLLWYSFLDLAHDLDPPKVHERTSHSHAVGLPNLVGSGQAVKCETAKWCEADRMLCLVRKSFATRFL